MDQEAMRLLLGHNVPVIPALCYADTSVSHGSEQAFRNGLVREQEETLGGGSEIFGGQAEGDPSCRWEHNSHISP